LEKVVVAKKSRAVEIPYIENAERVFPNCIIAAPPFAAEYIAAFNLR
jgi:hypothetical protein